MTNQIYEDYWSLTVGLTDFNSDKFSQLLQKSINFIEKHKDEEYSPNKYKLLQEQIRGKQNKNMASIRKDINTLVKLGFIESFLVSYNPDSLKYLEAKTNRKKKSLLSKIIYSESSFNKSISSHSDTHEINFLINTLVENGKLNQKEIIALMLVDIENFQKGFLNKEELQLFVTEAKERNFIERKYNQIGYLINILKKLDEIMFVNDDLYFTEDAVRIFGEALEKDRKTRNPYLHLLYKNQLKEESFLIYAKEKCMVEKLAYPSLIASHIKPFILSSEDEAYNPNNGLLLSRNLDILFDQGLISFTDEGEIIISNTELDNELINYLQQYKLNEGFLNSRRKEFLAFHRSHFEKKLFK